MNARPSSITRDTVPFVFPGLAARIRRLLDDPGARRRTPLVARRRERARRALFSRSGFKSSVAEAAAERDALRPFTVEDVVEAVAE